LRDRPGEMAGDETFGSQEKKSMIIHKNFITNPLLTKGERLFAAQGDRLPVSFDRY